jgi:hypothetical protein
MSILAPTSKYKVLKLKKKEGCTELQKILKGNMELQKGWRLALMHVQWVLQDLCSETMLNFHYVRLKHEVYFILFMYLNHKQIELHHSQCSTTQVFQQRTNTFSNHSHNQIKDQHTDVFTW